MKYIPFSKPDFSHLEEQACLEVIRSGWLTAGPKTALFEKKFGEYIDVKHALAVNSATSALHLGLKSLGIKSGDYVLTTTYTFTATADVIRYVDANPIFVDIDPKTLCLDPEKIEDKIQILKKRRELNKLKAIIPVHFGGHSCPMDEICQIARKYNLKIEEDAAHAFPTKYKGRFIGSIGDVTCFSFYSTKPITTGEGGMLCTDSDEIAEKVRTTRLHGISKDSWQRFINFDREWEYDVVNLGYKYNFTDIGASIGLIQLKKAGKMRKAREKISQNYFNHFSDIPGLILPYPACSFKEHSWHLFVIQIDGKRTPSGINRNQMIRILKKANIGFGIHYKPLHKMTYYRQIYSFKSDEFQVAEKIFNRCLSIPIYSALRESEQSYIIETICKALLSDKKN